jgi:hypothetical protein
MFTRSEYLFILFIRRLVAVFLIIKPSGFPAMCEVLVASGADSVIVMVSGEGEFGGCGKPEAEMHI